MEGIKITGLTIENVKRVSAVELEPAENGLTVIGGGNGQGKTSVLDAITWALGGERYRPSNAQREGSVLSPHIMLTLSNGLTVERKGANSTLTVTDPTGKRHGQTLLNEFVSTFAIDLPAFLDASDKEKAATLLSVIGVGDELRAIESEEKAAYDKRRTVGQLADRKKDHLAELPHYEDAPNTPVSAMELITRQQKIMRRNAENGRLRTDEARLRQEVERLKRELAETEAKYATAQKSAENLIDEETAELERDIAAVDETNRKVRANMEYVKTHDEAEEYVNQYNALNKEISDIRQRKLALLSGAKLPLPELSVDDESALTYRGKHWDCMSGAEQLRVGAAIARALKPECGFVLMDKLEAMDLETLSDFGKWLTENKLQAIVTRVSTGSECTIVITDGTAEAPAAAKAKAANKYEEVEF